jgi:hypothetical protein
MIEYSTILMLLLNDDYFATIRILSTTPMPLRRRWQPQWLVARMRTLSSRQHRRPP